MDRATEVGTSGRPELEPLEPRLLLSGTWVTDSITYEFATGGEGFPNAPCSLVLDSADAPHVGYIDEQFGFVGTYDYIRHATFNGWTWNRPSVTQPPDGAYLALALDSHHRPHLAYQTTDTWALK